MKNRQNLSFNIIFLILLKKEVVNLICILWVRAKQWHDFSWRDLCGAKLSCSPVVGSPVPFTADRRPNLYLHQYFHFCFTSHSRFIEFTADHRSAVGWSEAEFILLLPFFLNPPWSQASLVGQIRIHTTSVYFWLFTGLDFEVKWIEYLC